MSGNPRLFRIVVAWGVILSFAIIAAFYAGSYRYSILPVEVREETVSSTARTSDFRQNLADRLIEVAEDIRRMKSKDAGKIVRALSDISSRLDPISLTISGHLDERQPDACWEEFKGTQYGQPFYTTGFVEAADCPRGKMRPIEELVTVLLVLPPNGVPEDNDRLVLSIREHYPGMPIIVAAVPGSLFQSATVPAKEEDFDTPGVLWNRLVAAAKTPYVLVGRDLDYVDDLARLQRLIHVISSSSIENEEGSKGIAVAGGAFRNRTGHWAAGCLRASLRRYTLTLATGYRRSARDCMLCDVLAGPFVARTSALRRLPLDDKMAPAPLFTDWFLRARTVGALAAVCPDAMFFKRSAIEEHTSRSPMERKAWQRFASKWRIECVSFPSKQKLHFLCNEVGLSCNAREVASKSLAMPPCCLEQVTRTMKALDEFAKSNDIDYELDTGTALGAVKIRNFLPWDVDGDISFINYTYYIFKKNHEYFRDHNISSDSFRVRKGSTYFNYFSINSPDIVFEMWGANMTSRQLFTVPDALKAPTHVEMNGVWVRGPWSPGLYARNRYGPGYLQHVQHWSILKLGTSFAQYKPGVWKKCSVIPDHGCLQEYPMDGSFDLYSDDNFLS